MELITNEIEFHRRFKYPSIVEFVDHQVNKSRNESEVFIVMEFCPGGHLYDNMKKMGEKRFSLEELAKTFRALCALGCVLYTMAFFKPPFPPEGLRTSKFTIPSGHGYGKDVPELIKRMLCEDVEERANIDEVLACCDAILASQPLPKRGSVAKSTSRPGSGSTSRTNSADKTTLATHVDNSAPVIDLLAAVPAPIAPFVNGDNGGGFADFADFDKCSVSTPTSFDRFAPPAAPVGAAGKNPSKVIDSFGFLVSPTSAGGKHTEARDVFQAFDDCTPKPPSWVPTGGGFPQGGYQQGGPFPQGPFNAGGFPVQQGANHGYVQHGSYHPLGGAFPPQGNFPQAGFQGNPGNGGGAYPPGHAGGSFPLSPMGLHNLQSPPAAAASNGNWKSSYEFKF
ncbi:hypothetical protein DYB32_007670 [Aphanomyces invadans]|uniref:non-specific serine/threonine protein kinase n=1 Tax=Aphanomyces invadans TaxID=157072 RepID=A0A418AND9_9STRA|nr:hypothetical protein DYB32_007670 [Aphanomyces invadans]